MKKAFILILGLVALLVAGFFLRREKAAAPAPANGEQATEQQHTFAWRFETTEGGDGLSPRTQVDLITGGDVYDVGNFAGSCAEIASENLLQGEMSGVLCWWAGGGDEIGVFKDGAGYVVMRGTQEEPTAESDGFRGNFVELVAIK